MDVDRNEGRTVTHELEPETRDLIDQSPIEVGGVHMCGCFHQHDRWFTCAYHTGFDDGLRAAQLHGPNPAA